MYNFGGGGIINQLPCLVQGAVCQELGYNGHLLFMLALWAHPLLYSYLPPLGDQLQQRGPILSDTPVTSHCEHQLEGSLCPQKHAQATCLEPVRPAGELTSPGAILS